MRKPQTFILLIAANHNTYYKQHNLIFNFVSDSYFGPVLQRIYLPERQRLRLYFRILHPCDPATSDYSIGQWAYPGTGRRSPTRPCVRHLSFIARTKRGEGSPRGIRARGAILLAAVRMLASRATNRS